MSKRVLITGGGQRIGAALVKAFAEADWAVTIHAFQSAEAAEKLRLSLKNPDWHTVTTCDLSDPAERKAWLSTLDGFDLVINNASCYRLTPRGKSETASDRQRYWQVNYYAPLEIIEHQKKHLSATAEALAVTLLDCEVLTSLHGIKPYVDVPPGVDSYLSTRIKLAHQLQVLAREYAPTLRIAAIAPGPVLPPVNCTTPGMTRILDKVPMHQPVAVQEIVDTALYLWNNKSLTGTIIPVDGGMHLGVETPPRLRVFADPANWRVETAGVLLIIGGVLTCMGFFVPGDPKIWFCLSSLPLFGGMLLGNVKQKMIAAAMLLPLAATILGDLL